MTPRWQFSAEIPVDSVREPARENEIVEHAPIEHRPDRPACLRGNAGRAEFEMIANR
jgi:hypothetical protein